MIVLCRKKIWWGRKGLRALRSSWPVGGLEGPRDDFAGFLAIPVADWP